MGVLIYKCYGPLGIVFSPSFHRYGIKLPTSYYYLIRCFFYPNSIYDRLNILKVHLFGMQSVLQSVGLVATLTKHRRNKICPNKPEAGSGKMMNWIYKKSVYIPYGMRSENLYFCVLQMSGFLAYKPVIYRLMRMFIVLQNWQTIYNTWLHNIFCIDFRLETFAKLYLNRISFLIPSWYSNTKSYFCKQKGIQLNYMKL